MTAQGEADETFHILQHGENTVRQVGHGRISCPKERVNEALVKHELIHYYQANREGWLRWNIRYYWYLVKVGYRRNPYEVEAYALMHEPLTEVERQLTDLQRGYSYATS